jgi:hypothetical protein
MNNKSEANEENNFNVKLANFSEKPDYNFALENKYEINKCKFNTNNSTIFEKNYLNDIVSDYEIYRNNYSYNFRQKYENLKIEYQVLQNFSENDTSNIEIEIDECKVEKNIQIEYYNNLDFYISNNCNNFYLNDNS